MSELFESENGSKANTLVRNSENRSDIKAYIEAQWNEFKNVCANTKDFISQFPNNFTERWWELRVFEFLNKNSFKILKNTKEGPDFKIELENDRFRWVECISTRIGENESNKEEKFK